MNNEGWIDGQVPRLFQLAVQAEYEDGRRTISLCPACIDLQEEGKVVRYRLLSPEIKQAYVNGVVREPREEEQYGGERLKSKCCNADMVIVAGDDPVASTNYYLCLHCLRGADMKEMK